MSKPGSSSLLATTVTAISNHFKPHRAEALQRIRLNGMGLLTSLILSYLLPLPSIPKALLVVISAAKNSHYGERWSTEWVVKWACVLEITVLAIFTFNIAEAVYALSYPPAPLPPLPSPAKPKLIQTPAATPQRPFKILSPNMSPQPQKPFSFSPSASFSASISSPSSSGYPTSPISTPSRVLHYSPIPPSGSPDAHASSTTSSIGMISPTPAISAYRAAYRGKHSSGSVGSALDGSYFGRMTPKGEDEEDE